MSRLSLITQILTRNGPCWCGSGKKYKKCHLVKDKMGYHETGDRVDSVGKIMIGQPADWVLGRMPKERRVRPPEVIGQEEKGEGEAGQRLIVLWFYPAVTLEFRKRQRGKVECYRVTAIYKANETT
jgi:hypothetical protein